MVKAGMELPRDAKVDLYNLALSNKTVSEEGILQNELWAEAVFLITSGMYLGSVDTKFVSIRNDV